MAQARARTDMAVAVGLVAQAVDAPCPWGLIPGLAPAAAYRLRSIASALAMLRPGGRRGIVQSSTQLPKVWYVCGRQVTER